MCVCVSDSHWKSWVFIAKRSRRVIFMPAHSFSRCPVLWSLRKLVHTPSALSNHNRTFVLTLFTHV